MPITSKELLFKFSTQSGTAGNQNEQTDPQSSIGKYISLTKWEGETLNNLFDDITDIQNTALQVDYRCIFIHNAHISLTLINPIVWLPTQVADGAGIDIGVDTTVSSIISSSSPQALFPVDRYTAPVGVTFSNPTNKTTALTLGSIAAGFCKAIWMRRTATGSDILNDGFVINIEGRTLV